MGEANSKEGEEFCVIVLFPSVGRGEGHYLDVYWLVVAKDGEGE